MEDRLQKFARLVDTGSFTKAAQQLHISQPALTTAIKKLEHELRSELIIRGGHSFAVTAAGQTAYRTAKEMGVQTANLKLRLRELANDKVTLSVGMIDSVADLLFVHEDNLPLLEQGTHLSLSIDNSTRLIQYVEHNELDVAFVARPASLPRALTSEHLGDEPLVLVTQPTYLPQVVADIQKGVLHHFLSYNQNSQTYELITRSMSRQGVTLLPTFYSTSPEIILQILLSHRAAAVLPYLLVKPYLEDGALVRARTNRGGIIARPIASVYRTGRTLPGQIHDLRDRAQQQLQQLISQSAIRKR